MRRRIGRALATVGLVAATSTGLLVTSSGTAQALEWGPADRAAARALINGFQAGGVRQAAPGVVARMGARCVGPQVVGCAAGVVAAVGLGIIAYKTSDTWIPWLEGQIEENPGGV